MCLSTQQTRQRKPASKPRRPVATAIRGAAPVFLTLPAIAKKVPIRSVSEADKKLWLEAATLCAELVTDDDEFVIHDTTSARDIVKQALSIWATKHCRDINLLDGFSLVASFDHDSFGLDNSGCFEDKLNDGDFFVAIDSTQSTPFIDVQQKLEALEMLHPGFAHTIMHYAEIAGYRTLSAFTPSTGFLNAQNLYWMGLDDDEEFRKEMESCGDEEALDEDTLLPSTYLAAFPSFYFTGDLLDSDALHRIAALKDEASELAVDVALVTLSIMQSIDQDVRMPFSDEFYSDNAYFSCYMGKDQSMLGRVLDDFYQDAQVGEFTTVYGISHIKLTVESFRQWRVEMENGFALYGKINRLMNLIGDI